MSLVGGAIDLYMTYKFLRILTQRFSDTDAFKLGIIDERGTILKKRNTLKKPEERAAYTIFHRLIWKLKRLMEKIPLGKTKLASYAAALWFVKEEASKQGMVDPEHLETLLYEHLKEQDAVPRIGLNEKFETYMHEEVLPKGAYKLKVTQPDAGVVDTDPGPDMISGDFIDVKVDQNPIDTILGVDIYKVTHRDSGVEVILGREDLFKVN